VKHALGALGGILLGILFLRVSDAICRHRGLHPVRRRAVVVALVTACAIGIMHVLAEIGDLSATATAILFLAHGALAATVIVASAIDIDHWVLPNELTLGGAGLALVTSYVRAGGVASSLSGALVGLVAALVPWALYKKLRGGSGMGLGDVKLMLLAGAWHGPLAAIVVLFGGAVQTVVAALVFLALRRAPSVPEDVARDLDDLRRRAEGGDDEARAILELDPVAREASGFFRMPFPVGPFLALACIEMLFLRRPVLAALERFLAN
jgi:leader peptidase (prepilin peptidase) / N-methyltransferase